ncbi:MAG TPA: hypothetical protein DHV28_19415 [Ignavibacteriales bacterium]|nr:hypothetical protein [Ignavibacteriales bacterium]
MKKFRFAIVLCAFLFLAMLGCSDQSQSPVTPAEQSSLDKIIITEYTITSSPVLPFTENPYDYILMAGRTLYMKDYPVTDNVVASDARLTGQMEHLLSLKLDIVTGEGPCNGSFKLYPDPLVTDGGYWEGTYEGYRSKTDDPYVFVLPLRMVAHGNGGAIDKMQGFNDVTLTVYTNPEYYPLPIYWTAEGTGFIKEH